MCKNISVAMHALYIILLFYLRFSVPKLSTNHFCIAMVIHFLFFLTLRKIKHESTSSVLELALQPKDLIIYMNCE